MEKDEFKEDMVNLIKIAEEIVGKIIEKVDKTKEKNKIVSCSIVIAFILHKYIGSLKSLNNNDFFENTKTLFMNIIKENSGSIYSPFSKN